MPGRRTLPEFRYHLEQALECIEINVDAFKKGTSGGWLAVAAQLNVLLCDATTGPFIQKVIPGLSLHPLARDLADTSHKYRLDVTGTPHLFDCSKPRIPLDEWLDQTLAVLPIEDSGVPIRLRELIADSRNKLGPGHFVPSLKAKNEVEKRAIATLGFPVFNGKQVRPFHEEYLVAIGEYVIGQIREQYKDTYEGQVFIEDRMCTIKGDQALSYQIDQAVDFSQGVFLHAVVLLSKHAMDFRRTLFDVASVNSPLDLRIWLDEQNRIIATLRDESSKEFSLKPIPYEYFDRLVVIVCSLSRILDETAMEFVFSLNSQIVSRCTIRPSMSGAVVIRPVVGATVGGTENARMKVGSFGIGTGRTREEDHCLLGQRIVAEWSIA